MKACSPVLVNRRRANLQHGNVSAHTVNVTNLNIEELKGLEFQSNLAPPEYNIFRVVAHFLFERRYNNVDEGKTVTERLLSLSQQKMYMTRAKLLAQRWGHIIEYNGIYFDE